MSLSTQELSRKISSDSLKTSSSEGKEPDGSFLKLLEVHQVDEHPHHSLFSLIEEESEEDSSEEEIDTNPIVTILEAPYIAPLAIESATTTKITQEISLPAPLTPLFEKMASRMMVMDLSHETHTTLFLDNPQFIDSPFFGTKIVIKEFTSAPKAFNIEIISNPTAVATIQKYQSSLSALFSQGNFLFTVHRLETQIEQERDLPILHRHEEEGQGQKEQHEDKQS